MSARHHYSAFTAASQRLRLLLEDASDSPRNPDGTVRAMMTWKRPVSQEMLCEVISTAVREILAAA